MTRTLEQTRRLELRQDDWESELGSSGLPERIRELLSKALRAHIAGNHNYPRTSDEEFDSMIEDKIFFVRLGEAPLLLEIKGPKNNRFLFLKEED